MTSEKVQYDIAVLTEGREEVDKLFESWSKLHTLAQDSIETSEEQAESSARVVEQFKREGEKTTKNLKGQKDAGTSATGQMNKMTAPLRELGALFQNFNPVMLASTLGVAGFAATMGSLAQGWDTYTTSMVMAGATMNQFNEDHKDYNETQKELQRMADALGISVKELIPTYTELLKQTEDSSIAESILADAYKVREASGMSLHDASMMLLKDLKEGLKAEEDGTTTVLLGNDARKKRLELVLAAADPDIADRIKTADLLTKVWDEKMLKVKERFSEAWTQIKLLGVTILSPKEMWTNVWGPMFANLPEKIKQDVQKIFQKVWGSLSENLKGDAKKVLQKVWDDLVGWIPGAWSKVPSKEEIGEAWGKFTGWIKDQVLKIPGLDDIKGVWTSVRGWSVDVMKKVPGLDDIKGAWNSFTGSVKSLVLKIPGAEDIGKLWTSVRNWARGAMEKVPGLNEIRGAWNAFAGTVQNLVMQIPGAEKIAALWTNVRKWVHDNIDKVPVLAAIRDRWVGFAGSIKDLVLQGPSTDEIKGVWDKVRARVTAELEKVPGFGKAKELWDAFWSKADALVNRVMKKPKVPSPTTSGSALDIDFPNERSAGTASLYHDDAKDEVGTWSKPYDLTHLAEGGIVTQPTNARIGEKGREAVIPLDQAGGDKGILSGTLVVELDGEVLATAVFDRLDERIRLRGGR